MKDNLVKDQSLGTALLHDFQYKQSVVVPTDVSVSVESYASIPCYVPHDNTLALGSNAVKE